MEKRSASHKKTPKKNGLKSAAGSRARAMKAPVSKSSTPKRRAAATREPKPRRASAGAAKPAALPPEPEAPNPSEEVLPSASPLLAFEAADAIAAVGRLMAAIAKRPQPMLKRLTAMTDELGACLLGKKKLEPPKSDRRFLDSAWNDNEYFRRLLQVYLSVAGFIRDIPECVELNKREDLARLGLNFAADGLSPTNTFMGNPAALRRAIDTGGSSILAGLRNFAQQMTGDRAHPEQVASHAFVHGKTVAATRGDVVYRNEMFELLQYAPTTETVYEHPVVFFCSPVNPYYVLDLSPGKSLFEYLVAQGFTVFAISLKNPESSDVDWGLNEYANVVLKATDVARDICGVAAVHLATACAGSVISTLLAAALSARKDQRLRTLTTLVSMIDASDVRGGLPLADAKMADRSVARTRKRGILNGDRVFWMFSLMRPNEAFWNYWVENFLLGNSPRPNDLLFWANENTNIPAALLRDLLDVYVHNKAITPGRMTVLNQSVDLSKIKLDVYTLAAEKDHLMPWRSGFNSMKHFSGNRTFVLHKKGHIMAMIDPLPGDSSAYYVGDGGLKLGADAWRARAHLTQGSWWPHWRSWLVDRSGAQRPAPAAPGSARFPSLGPAPGEYVRFKVSDL